MSKSFAGKVAVIQFPGVNCEYETVAAARSVGLEAELFRWNLDPGLLEESLAVVLPGGFSYQDRIRAGVVAAKDHIMDKLSQLASTGRPLLGICNGAQVLVESGFIPGLHWERVDLALAPNVMADREGYYCNWVHLRNERSPCAWTSSFREEEVIPVPIAHAEGRFVTDDTGMLEQIKKNGQIALRYCTSSGLVDPAFPVNPNGSMENIAGVCNREGNVLALMPHPERATWLRQVPEDLEGEWGRKRKAAAGRNDRMEDEGPGRRFFASLLSGKGAALPGKGSAGGISLLAEKEGRE
ncbi:MAG: phosphoribosylformylglycinamidine synthase I [Candidatus Krumholzibacteriota bacterium]|nr:phosphoribosylformylglycinamidine synthase I [Candidatus Krumholzibacteriota bacterium]